MPLTEGSDSSRLEDITFPDETEMLPASEPEELKREREELQREAEEIHKEKPTRVTDKKIAEWLKRKNRLEKYEKTPKKKVA